jgi:ubiquinone/menaquinone biosynthesis C-methylase UbiE
MAQTDTKFSGSIPAIYDRLLVPLIFAPYAADLCQRLVRFKPADILETAAGTGVVTRAMAEALPASVKITATDLNPSMLEVARARLGDDARITWQPADALALPFADGSFDAVVCQFGVMFFPDRIKGYREALRVLKPNGTFLFDAWDRIEASPFVDVIAATLKRVYAADPPDFMARVPHGYHDKALIEREVREAGFATVTIETIVHTARAASAQEAATAWCQGTPLRNEIELRGPPALNEVTEIVAKALEKSFGKGAIEGKIAAHVVTAKRA